MSRKSTGKDKKVTHKLDKDTVNSEWDTGYGWGGQWEAVLSGGDEDGHSTSGSRRVSPRHNVFLPLLRGMKLL